MTDKEQAMCCAICGATECDHSMTDKDMLEAAAAMAKE